MLGTLRVQQYQNMDIVSVRIIDYACGDMHQAILELPCLLTHHATKDHMLT